MRVEKVVLFERFQIILNRDPGVLIKIIIYLTVLPNTLIIFTKLIDPILPFLLLSSLLILDP